jgi:hypothetical protein
MKTSQQKLKNYYRELPEGFTQDYVIDAKKKSTGFLFSVAAIVIMILVLVVGYFIKFPQFPAVELYDLETIASLFLFVIAMLAYIVLHELTHGLVYKLITKQKLKFGLTFTVAYCGLKEGYVNKPTALTALLAPFVVHDIWMLVLLIVLPANFWAFLLLVLFSYHVGGCAGDLYDTLLLIFKYHNKQVLMHDNGPKQTFYLPSNL